MKFRKLFLIFLALFVFAMPTFAQTGGAPAGTTDWKAVGGAIAMAIASGLCGLAQGRATHGAAEAFARNPGATAQIRMIALLGLVLIESMALYTFVIVVK